MVKKQVVVPRREPTAEEMAAYKKMEYDAAVASALEWMDDIANNFERGAARIRDYKARFLEAVAEDEPNSNRIGKPEDVISWVVNEVNNVERNHRLDMAVNHAVRVAQKRA